MSATITDVIFDYCDVLLDWRPRIPLEGQYPPGVIDMFFSADDPHGFRYYDRLSDSGWDEERILADYRDGLPPGHRPVPASTPQPRCSWMTSRQCGGGPGIGVERGGVWGSGSSAAFALP